MIQKYMSLKYEPSSEPLLGYLLLVLLERKASPFPRFGRKVQEVMLSQNSSPAEFYNATSSIQVKPNLLLLLYDSRA